MLPLHLIWAEGGMLDYIIGWREIHVALAILIVQSLTQINMMFVCGSVELIISSDPTKLYKHCCIARLMAVHVVHDCADGFRSMKSVLLLN